MSTKLGIVIPVYNNVFWTRKTIESVLKTTKSTYIILLIDDDSTDETSEYVKELINRQVSIYYKKNSINEGVNASWNKGIQLAKELFCTHIAVLNNDLELTDNWEEALIETLKNDKIGIVSPYSTHGPKLPENFPLCVGGKNPAGPQIKLLGSCFMFKASLIDIIGYIPNRIIYYFGDNWFQTMCEKQGLSLVYNPKSYVHHYFCQTTAKLDNCYWVEKDKLAYLSLGI